VAAAVKAGPQELSDGQKLFFLTDPLALSRLHVEVSRSPAAHPGWALASQSVDRAHRLPLRQAS
jgi:membrane glycosyltransferase